MRYVVGSNPTYLLLYAPKEKAILVTLPSFRTFTKGGEFVHR